METQNTQPGIGSTLQAYEDKIAAQIRAANTRIDEFEAKAKPRRAQAEVAAIDGLKATRQNIERMLVDLKTTGDAQAVRGGSVRSPGRARNPTWSGGCRS